MTLQKTSEIPAFLEPSNTSIGKISLLMGSCVASAIIARRKGTPVRLVACKALPKPAKKGPEEGPEKGEAPAAEAAAAAEEEEPPAPPPPPPPPIFNPAKEVGVTAPLGYFDPLGFCKKGDYAGFHKLRSA